MTYFAEECKNTINKSGYEIPKDFIISSPEQIPDNIKTDMNLIKKWHRQALEEKKFVLNLLREVFAL